MTMPSRSNVVVTICPTECVAAGFGAAICITALAEYSAPVIAFLAGSASPVIAAEVAAGIAAGAIVVTLLKDYNFDMMRSVSFPQTTIGGIEVWTIKVS